ncbi:MAG TPA: hypothetical protein VFE61_14270 [Candidatus Sulfotelmatobacter sp.]|jgi:hypothetical protein|nr:hypothetical protein [Candidatus Sulfotelmatobacter sp.]
MPSAKTDSAAILRRKFASARPPEKITQEAYEGNPKHLRRLARLRPGDRADVGDLWEYTQDLLYPEIQGSLLAYLLPFSLEAWRDDLRGTRQDYGGFVEHFYPVLANRQVFGRHLTPSQSAAVSDFMRESMLEEIDDQCGLSYRGSGSRPYRWITALTTFGALLPEVSRLWTAWWSVTTSGRAIAAVQYVSCLIYSQNENPVFAPWTPDRGGGPPCLWEFGGHLYTHRWLDENIRFLRQTLNPREVTEVLNQAVIRLVDQPEHAVAAEVQADLPLCEDTLAARWADLPNILETKREPGILREWSR